LTGNITLCGNTNTNGTSDVSDKTDWTVEFERGKTKGVPH